MNILAWNTSTDYVGLQLTFEMVAQREGIVSDFPSPEEISRSNQMLVAKLLGEHEILARCVSGIILTASCVKLHPPDTPTSSLRMV